MKSGFLFWDCYIQCGGTTTTRHTSWFLSFCFVVIISGTYVSNGTRERVALSAAPKASCCCRLPATIIALSSKATFLSRFYSNFADYILFFFSLFEHSAIWWSFEIMHFFLPWVWTVFFVFTCSYNLWEKSPWKLSEKNNVQIMFLISN